jgi:hypothetical protein
MDLCGSEQGTVVGCKNGVEPSDFMKERKGNFLDYLCNW